MNHRARGFKRGFIGGAVVGFVGFLGPILYGRYRVEGHLSLNGYDVIAALISALVLGLMVGAVIWLMSKLDRAAD